MSYTGLQKTLHTFQSYLGPICYDQTWDETEANVLCKQMGYSKATEYQNTSVVQANQAQFIY